MTLITVSKSKNILYKISVLITGVVLPITMLLVVVFQVHFEVVFYQVLAALIIFSCFYLYLGKPYVTNGSIEITTTNIRVKIKGELKVYKNFGKDNLNWGVRIIGFKNEIRDYKKKRKILDGSNNKLWVEDLEFDFILFDVKEKRQLIELVSNLNGQVNFD